jgi:hypothetical protein
VDEGAWESGRGPELMKRSGKRVVEDGRDAARSSGARGLVEVELGYGLGIGRVERGRLVEVVVGQGIGRRDGLGLELEWAWGGARAWETRGAVWRRPRWRRMAPTGPGSLRKARMRMSAPHSGQRRGKAS